MSGTSYLDVEEAIRSALSKGYVLSPKKTIGQNGVDITAQAKKGDESVDIEVIGRSQNGSKRSFDFCQAFFRAISRLNGNASTIAIALPNEWEAGLKSKLDNLGEGWERIALEFPEVEIWLVDIKDLTFRRTKLTDWVSLRSNSGKPVLHIVNVNVIGPHALKVEFNDGMIKNVDLTPLIHGEVFEPLRDPKYFKQVRLDPECKTVTWPNGADLAPEALYELKEFNPVSDRRRIEKITK